MNQILKCDEKVIYPYTVGTGGEEKGKMKSLVVISFKPLEKKLCIYLYIFINRLILI